MARYKTTTTSLYIIRVCVSREISDERYRLSAAVRSFFDGNAKILLPAMSLSRPVRNTRAGQRRRVPGRTDNIDRPCSRVIGGTRRRPTHHPIPSVDDKSYTGRRRDPSTGGGDIVRSTDNRDRFLPSAMRARNRTAFRLKKHEPKSSANHRVTEWRFRKPYTF